MNARYLILVLLLGCSSKSSGGASAATAGSGSSTGMKKGAPGGFSAALNADLAKETGGDPKSAVAETKPAPAPAPVPAVVAETKPAPAPTADTKPEAVPTTPAKRGPAKVPPELAAIKFDLEPNWDRDYDGAGTFGFELRIPKSTSTRVFYFHYGYDDPSAPTDRDLYLKWIADAKILTPTLNRQRGAAWYLEGTDGKGSPTFRYLINYGGKHLICYGSLYKDAASNALGNLRDEVLMQAKKICETLTL